MISNNVVNHNGFVNRSENIIKTWAKTVGENIVLYSPQSAINAWLNSPGHKENIVGILLILVFQYEKILKQAKNITPTYLRKYNSCFELKAFPKSQSFDSL
jgi:hypothetical protein